MSNADFVVLSKAVDDRSLLEDFGVFNARKLLEKHQEYSRYQSVCPEKKILTLKEKVIYSSCDYPFW